MSVDEDAKLALYLQSMEYEDDPVYEVHHHQSSVTLKEGSRWQQEEYLPAPQMRAVSHEHFSMSDNSGFDDADIARALAAV
jgi:hypothetical protein